MQIRAITRRLENALSGLDDAFGALYTATDFRKKIEELKAIQKSGNTSRRPSVLKRLFEMFDSCGIPYEKGKNDAYYEALVECAKLPTFVEIEEEMIHALHQRYRMYPQPEEYMLRIVDRLAPQEGGSDTLRLRILKKFIEAGDYLKEAGYKGKKHIQDHVKNKIGKKVQMEDVLLHLDDDVFACLKDAEKSQLKPDGTYGLLKLADDLATGKFRTEGATKKGLYLFAIVFGMTYYTGTEEEEEEIPGFETDIEKNLFQDYYTNNLMRFISEAYKEKKLCEFEIDPSGQGINYKSFVEMVYLYYLARDYSPKEKIKLAAEMIKRIEVRQFKGQGIAPDIEGEPKNTRMFKEMFSETILQKTEEEFETFLCMYYDCDTYSGITYESKNKEGKTKLLDGKRSAFQLETEQNTAYANYQKIIKGLEALEMPLEECAYGLWFTDVATFQKKEKDYGDFTELLCSVDRFLKNKHLNVKNAKEVTRTSIIVAYYYYYNALHENDRNDRRKSFDEVFQNFKQGVDKLLVDSFYQPLNGKNIFDVLVVFSAYAYLNI